MHEPPPQNRRRNGFESQRTMVKKEDFLMQVSEHDKKLIPSFLQKILQIDEAGVAALRTKIAKQRGMLRVFVHPLYLQGRNVSSPRHRSSEAIERGLERHIDASSDVPLIVLEEQAKIDPLRQKGVLSIPTQKGDPALEASVAKDALSGLDLYLQARQVVEEGQKKEKSELLSVDDSWGRYVESDAYIDDKVASKLRNIVNKLILSELGVKRLIVGGMYFEDTPTEGMQGCVSSLVESAQQLGIEVVLSRYHMDWNGKNVDGRLLV